MLTLALPKGRLAEETALLLQSKGWLKNLPSEGSKELTYVSEDKRLRLLFVRSQDVCTYVEEAAADAGIVGWDILKEGGFDLVAPVDLKLGACRLSLASFPDFDLFAKRSKVRVATKYPNLTREYFFSKGISCEIIKLYGSIELAPIVGLSDCIVDLVSTGGTLKANGLKEFESILYSTARLVANRSSFYHKHAELRSLIESLEN
ncbi:ATP phosphoribosyltransferase [Leptospira jelokensis]|uniref:ATP phosphoribosyltransferase n=1 Tax=Leptospira jelokensis TaxID=2484931 RepID=A0A4Z0ZT36_9LEPT|nr:ATP phosphoribosyltransferase [Leptospira jelokensis]TGL67489.1 ATP phosphoribosyltransferase [Leptospira jelokensis]TGM05170.1 ATP phosphoribosyltransferase [Leptospira jelokensis]